MCSSSSVSVWPLPSFDAVVIRCLIVPAVMQMLGKRAWWLPRWLDRALPNVDVEGEGLRALDEKTGDGDHDRKLVGV